MYDIETIRKEFYRRRRLAMDGILTPSECDPIVFWNEDGKPWTLGMIESMWRYLIDQSHAEIFDRAPPTTPCRINRLRFISIAYRNDCATMRSRLGLTDDEMNPAHLYLHAGERAGDLFDALREGFRLFLKGEAGAKLPF